MVLSRILRAGEGKTLKHLKRIVEEVNDLEDSVVDLTDAELRAKTDEFRKRNANYEAVDTVFFSGSTSGSAVSATPAGSFSSSFASGSASGPETPRKSSPVSDASSSTGPAC